MAPLESRREPGAADPSAAEAGQIPSGEPASAKPADPDRVDEASTKVLKQKHRKKHSAAKSEKSKSAKKPQVVASDSDGTSDDTISSSDDSSDDVDDDEESESEVEPKKSKRVSRTETDARRSKRALLKKKGKKKKGKASQLSSSESESDDALDVAGEEGTAVVVEDTKSDKRKARSSQQGKQELSIQQLQQLSQILLQGQAFLTQPNQLGFVPGTTAGQIMSPDVAQIQAAMRSPFLQQLANTHLGAQNTAHKSDQSELPSSKQKANKPGNQRGQNTGGRGRRVVTEEIEKPPRNGLEFKRVDQVWDSSIHNYKLKDTTQSPAASKYEGYLFHVRRTFDWEGKYKTTYVDIKSKELRECLREVIGDIKGISLVEETPKLDPNLLFLYLEDFRKHLKALKRTTVSGLSKKERKQEEKRIETKRRHLKVLVKYIDQDYAEVKRSLYPMLDNGLITFDLLWALWKPSTLVYTTTYGCHDEPRAFKVGMAEKHYSMMRGDFYWVEGKYFEYDGKQFGYGTTSIEIPDFQGARKITSLPCYPLWYHKDEAGLRETLIERGKKFSRLSGVHYKSHQGMAFFKKKKAVVKVNINGRVMVDPAIHRRINPNYQVSVVRPKDHETGTDGDETDDDDCYEWSPGGEGDDDSDASDEPQYTTRLVKDKNGNVRLMKIPKEEAGRGTSNKLDAVTPKDGESDVKVDTEGSEATDDAEGDSTPAFSDEEYLISSPLVLGFAFSEKLWLEFTVSGIKEIQWNEGAYESLVLEPKTKDIVKALVESHKYHATESIDDVIQGKGKGLVAVLHGPPGTGKTLTAEGISELLKCPLYMASAGELGTDSRLLEGELQKILDICHAWGAILLLDEADVFLEKRNMHDIHRNALVSIFLRQLEYFQGILFLTTNRVETFDDAFQSRIHIALRYDPLTMKAKKAIFKIFVERVRVLEKCEAPTISDEDYTDLAKQDLNGRQIKNTVRTAQALAVNRGEPLGMQHIRQVLDVHVSFERDLRGGVGYQEAMRSYF